MKGNMSHAISSVNYLRSGVSLAGPALTDARPGGQPQASSTAVTSARASCLMHQAKWPSLPSAVKAFAVPTA